ncbi:GNAT family N-acetyltransferase [Shimazuella kribbensis]|uniref:GNAT family N-acetyltransferase n=1 Tax=Shimazuella kribbensis TaxID=139808 RepID=UPI00041FB07B|nr:GNAT family protein [Shimazuella kribbensis]
MNPIIQSDQLILKKTQRNDLAFVLRVENENTPFIDSWTRDQHIHTMESIDMEHLIIQSVSTGKAVGYMIMTDLHNPHGSYYLKRIVVDEKRKGFGKEALRLLKAWCFNELQAHRLYLDVKEFNKRAQKLYDQEGFSIEGIARECRKEGDQYISLVSMSILKQEYKEEHQ